MTVLAAPLVLTARKATPPALTRETLRLIARTNLYALARDLLGYCDMTPAFHEPMLLWSQTDPHRKKLHMAPRGSFKSSGLTVAKSVQRVLTNPNIRILLGSNKAQNAEAMLKEIKGHLASELLVWLFPEILVADPEKSAPQWTTGAITVRGSRIKGAGAKEATIQANGVEGELTSQHYEVGCFDDLVGLENSQTREERQKVIRWIDAAQSLVDQPTPARAWQDFVGTPWDFDDAYADLLKKRRRGDLDLGVYIRPCWEPHPAGVEVPGYGRVRATFPERLSIPVLLALRKSIGPSRFAAQYLLKPTDPETAVFQRLDPSPQHPDGVPAIRPRRAQPPLDTLWLAMTVDPAISVKGWADYSALAVCGWDHANNQHVLWLRWGRWAETELIAQVYLAYTRFAAQGRAPALVGFEAVGFQKLYRHLFTSEGEKRGHILPITGLERDTKRTKNTRIQVLEPGWNAGELILYDDLDALDDLLDMAAKFRLDKELARDDLLDALADNHQLRIRPGVVGAPPALPEELAARQALELQIQQARAAQGLEPLDPGSLFVARMQQRAKREAEEERAMVALGAGFDEAWDVAYR